MSVSESFKWTVFRIQGLWGFVFLGFNQVHFNAVLRKCSFPGVAETPKVFQEWTSPNTINHADRVINHRRYTVISFSFWRALGPAIKASSSQSCSRCLRPAPTTPSSHPRSSPSPLLVDCRNDWPSSHQLQGVMSSHHCWYNSVTDSDIQSWKKLLDHPCFL